MDESRELITLREHSFRSLKEAYERVLVVVCLLETIPECNRTAHDLLALKNARQVQRASEVALRALAEYAPPTPTLEAHDEL